MALAALHRRKRIRDEFADQLFHHGHRNCSRGPARVGTDLRNYSSKEILLVRDPAFPELPLAGAAVHCDADNASVDDLLRKRHVAEVHTESMSQEESDDTNSRNDTADHRSLPTKIDSKTIESCATPTDPKKMIAQDVKACIRKSSSSWLPVESVYADVPLLKVLLGSARPHTACTLLKVALNGSGIHSEVREGVLQVGI